MKDFFWDYLHVIVIVLIVAALTALVTLTIVKTTDYDVHRVDPGQNCLQVTYQHGTTEHALGQYCKTPG